MVDNAESKHEGTDDIVDEATGSAQATGPTAPKHRKHRNGLIVLGVVVVVIVVCAVGFNIWHQQPSFCNAICHSPMDNYVESYSSGDPGKLVTVHADNDVNCLDCHNPKLTEQASEVCAWLGDSYPVDAEGNLVDASAQDMASEEFCLRSGCHNWDDVVNSTWGFADNDAKYNPHSSHQDGSVKCGDCHKSHGTSTLYCAKCHQLNLPEGWEATSD